MQTLQQPSWCRTLEQRWDVLLIDMLERTSSNFETQTKHCSQPNPTLVCHAHPSHAAPGASQARCKLMRYSHNAEMD